MGYIAVLGTGDATEVIADTPLPPPLLALDRASDAVLLPVPGAVFPTIPKDRAQCATAYVAAGLNAEASGATALYINTVGDYGLSALRAAAKVPVAGSGSASIRTALVDAECFAFVTLWPPAMRFIYDAILEETGTTEQCVELIHLSDDSLLENPMGPREAMGHMQACGLTTVNAVVDAIESVRTRYPGCAMILGCTCMYPLAPRLAELGLAVIDPMRAGYEQLLAELEAA